MSAMAFMCRGGRSIGNIFDALYSRAKACRSVSIGFHNGRLGGRAYIHTKRYIRPSFTQKLNPGDVKTKLELRLTNTVKGFQIYYMAPAEIKGVGIRKRLARLYTKPYRFDDDWLPYVELMVKNQSPELRSLMDKYWLESADNGAQHDLLRSCVMMYRGMQNHRILFPNYWEETVYTALPFLEEGREHYLGKILKDFHRGEFYKGIDFVEGLSRIVGADVAVEFKENDDTGHKEAVAVMLLLDEEKNPINHPECGIKCPSRFLFSGASMY